MLQHSISATADRPADLFVVAGYSYKALLIECITPCVSGDRDTVNRGPVCDRGPACDRGPVDRVQSVAEGPDLKVMQYSHLSSSEAVLYHLSALCEFISLSGQDCGLVSLPAFIC